ncbi:AAA-ATPase At3g28610-like [Miscanthus floridulus]|uniref:AAA-ATPase At3g28610-like n=1 Tax=Miscanthus floridulus TaxID=154761 RepID=UPI00345B4466
MQTQTSNSYSRDRGWNHIDFKHPTTFDTLAMDPAKKKEIMDDLDAFRSNMEFFKRTGKPWKRGYLLYRPPGKSKSTMIAAMANYLNYDIYDVELTVVRHNHDLRKLLAETTDKSIVVIEDIDCSLDLTGKRGGRRQRRSSYDDDDDERPRRVTLSGLLNFIDGLWSSCGGERIVVFTTNHVDKLDPALIRRGRMDMHIEMSYCGFDGFRTLARNCFGVDEHQLFDAVRELLREVQITPADVAEYCLMTSTRAGRGVESSLEHLIEEVKKDKARQKLMAEAAAGAAAAATEAAKSPGEKKGRRRRNRGKKQEEKHGDNSISNSVVTKES